MPKAIGIIHNIELRCILDEFSFKKQCIHFQCNVCKKLHYKVKPKKLIKIIYKMENYILEVF